jgi:hypothetical protein
MTACCTTAAAWALAIAQSRKLQQNAAHSSSGRLWRSPQRHASAVDLPSRWTNIGFAFKYGDCLFQPWERQ